MLIQTNSTTERLEAFGRNRLLDRPHVIKSPDNSAGVFFLVGMAGKTWPRWVSLGWTAADAKARLAEIAAERGEE
jgi:hypothetical protein